MDHFRPHRNPKFEGYYVRFMLPSGGSLILVMCSVPKSPDRPANIALSYVPPDGGKAWSTELWPESISPQHLPTSSDDFELVTNFHSAKPKKDPEPHIGRMAVTGSTVSYKLQTDEIYISANATNHTPWSSERLSPIPEGWLANLPLPLHWHVLSVESAGTITIRLPSDANLDPRDAQPDLQCTAHIEKNWAMSFPSAHVWIQALQHNPAAASPSPPSNDKANTTSTDDTTTHASQNAIKTKKATSILSLAGGKTLGLHAYLVSYRTAATRTTPPIALVFRPPFTISLPQFWRHRRHPEHGHDLLPALSTPFFSCNVSWPRASENSSKAKDHTTVPRINLTATKPLRGWRLEIRASVPVPNVDPSTPTPTSVSALKEQGFFTFSAPHPGGFRDAWMAQNVRGTVAARVLRRRKGLFGRWEVVLEETMQDAGVEFGGEFFPLRGKVKDEV